MRSPAAPSSTPSSSLSPPRFATPRDLDRPTRGPETLAHLIRLRRALPWPWQHTVADVAGELADDGAGWRYRVVLVSVPRRAGKTTLTLAANLDRLDVIGDARGWYTAHLREVAAKLFRDEWLPMVDTPALRRWYRPRRSQGSEGIWKRAGSSRLQLFAPTGDALHSTNADTVTVDEAWAFDTDTGEALESGARFAQLTRPWRQLWIVSAGGTIESTWWDRWLCAGEQGVAGVALFDWGADAASPDYDPGNPAIWTTAHPTAAHSAIVADAVAHEWATRADDATFERGILNVWPRPSQVTVAAGLELAAWAAASSPAAVPTVTAIAFDVAADRSSAALAVAGPGPDGRVTVEVVDHRPGVAWLAGAVRKLRAAHRGVPVVADALVTASVVAELGRARVAVDPVGARDHAQACGTFVDLLITGRLAHRSQAVLDDAVTGAARRPLGDAWLWSRARSHVDISPLVAVTLAAWAAHRSIPGGRAAVVVPIEPSDGRVSRERPIARTRGTTRGRFAAPGGF